MLFSLVSLFPEIVEACIQTSITGKALEKKLLEFETVQIRDFALNQYGQVDDTLYGGGTGMLLRTEPVFFAWEKASTSYQGSKKKSELKQRTIYLSPKGQLLNQDKVKTLAEYDQLILLCGHYEGIDERVLDKVVDEHISIGDYILTGGEIAAAVVIDAVSRLILGVLPHEDAYLHESHMNGLLEEKQYTKPAVWQSKRVPDVLLSGNQEAIRNYRRASTLSETLRNRPDLLEKAELSLEDFEGLIAYLANEK